MDNEVAKRNLYLEIGRIQKALKVPKTNSNNFGKYKYRSCSDILEAVKPLLNELFLGLTDEIVEFGNTKYVKATAIVSDGLTNIQMTAFAREAVERKGMDDSQITGAASSYARKYALCGLFAIDESKDADSNEYSARLLADERAKEEERNRKELSYKDAAIYRSGYVSTNSVTPEQINKTMPIKTTPLKEVKKTYVTKETQYEGFDF